MAIILTQNNYGIGIYNTFIDEKTKVVKDITNYTCNVDIIYPDHTTENIALEKIDAINGQVLFLLSDNQTSQAGLYKLYFNLIDSNSKLTAKKLITYYVMAEKGGL